MLARHVLPRRGDRQRRRHRRRRHHRRGATVHHAVDVVDRRVVGHVVDGGDVGDLRHIGVADIVGAGAIGWAEHLLRPQRHPADRTARPVIAPAPGDHRRADTDRDAEGEEVHERRRIDWPAIHRLRHTLNPYRRRHPAPARIHLYPAAVVERCETPGRIVDPGPAPGRDERPVAVAIRHVVDLDAGIPNAAIVGRGVPTPVVVEVPCPGHQFHHRRRHDGAHHYRTRWRPLAGHHVAQEGVHHGRANAGLETVAARDCSGLVGRHLQYRCLAGHHRRALDHRDPGRVRGVAGDHAVTPSAGDGDRPARGADGIARAVRAAAQVEVELAAPGAGHHRSVIEGDHLELGRGVEHHAIALDLDFRLPARLGPHHVVRGDGIVQRGGFPLVSLAGAE